MKTLLYIFVGIFSMAALASCGKLNPKTEGHIQSALEAQKQEFQKCYEAALKDDRNINGDVNLTLEFAPKAKKPKSAKVANSNIKNPKMLKCVSNAADKIEIEEAPGVFIEGQYTVNFQAVE